jgi:hypothetical protein
MLSTTARKTAVTVAALAAFGMGGAAVAGATGSGATATTAQDRRDHQPLATDVAAKVKAAALAEVPGATVLRTEAGGPDGAAYHAHIKTASGTLEVVLVDASFQATAVQADRRGAHGDGRDGHGRHGDETPLTGDTKTKVEGAVLAKYPGATIVRTETNTDSSAPYESHITTSAGKELEVLVSKDFAVVGENERPARP